MVCDQCDFTELYVTNPGEARSEAPRNYGFVTPAKAGVQERGV